jgi:nitroimidazol reductase NimA-like FMN-containing flavoprotein (pyridoxamine 5'-phosphate oxidase superfamily)
MRTIRRKDREIGRGEALQLLSSCEYGVLSTVGNDGQPYGLPLSYACKDNRIYFHCAVDGHKIDNITGEPRVSFCVVGNTRVLPEKFATEYESAVAFGVASEIFGSERHAALVLLLEKYSPGFIEEGKKYIEQKDRATRVFKIEIGHISAKARR